MDTSQILTELRAERDRLNQAIAAIESLSPNGNNVVRRGRPKKSTAASATSAQPLANAAQGRRSMSPAARRRISLAAKKRWVAKRSSAQPQGSTKQTAPKQVAAKTVKSGISAAGRKRISEMMKKRWAARKKAAAKAT